MGLHHKYEYSVSTFAALILSAAFFVASASAQSVQQDCADQSGDRAIAACSQALRLNPNDAISYYNRGNKWRDKGENDKAIADFTAAIRQNPKEADFYNNRGVVWKKKGEIDIAIADYDEAIKLNRQYWEAHNNRASAWLSKREHSKAIADFNEAIRLNPRNAIIYKNRGQVWQEIGDYDKAISDLTAAIRLDPQYAEAYNMRGTALEARGSLQKALTDFKTYTELTPSANDGKRAIARVEAKLNPKPDQLQKRTSDEVQAGVPVKKFGGTFTVPVHINGVITLDFMIDSDASDVSIPADVVSTLIRTGSIKTSDFTGEQIYRLADGSTYHPPPL